MKPRLFLVDAHAYLHRAYHALPPLSSPQGEPVGALYGFARMLLQLVKKEKPAALAVCFDTPGPTFRHEAYKEYKATRKELDADLIAQLKRARELAEAMGFTCLEAPGFEADDIMATLARGGKEEGYEAVLVTGDKDALQLVGPGIRVLNVAKNAWLDAPQVLEKFGVGPQSVVAYLSLIGDSSDNVPGVAGVGPVGAVKLLKKYGDLEGIFKAAKIGGADLSPKLAKTLIDGEKSAQEAVSLIRLRTDVPLEAGPAACVLKEPPREKLLEVLGRLGFNSLIRELAPGEAPEPAAAPAETGLREVPFKDLEGGLAKTKTLLVACLANESQDLLETAKARLALGLPDGTCAILEDKDKMKAARLLEGRALKAGSDLKETEKALHRLGLALKGPKFDAMLAAYVLDPSLPKVREAAEKEWKAALLLKLSKAQAFQEARARMKKEGVLKLYEELELPLASVLAGMEEEGVAVDVPYLKSLALEFDKEMSALKARLDALAGAPINVNSSKQLAELLYDKLGLPALHKTAKGARSTDEEALKGLAQASPIPAKVLEFRELSKLKSTYIDGLLERVDPADGRVHTHFDQAGTATGRLSSVDPNLQNIPIRSAQGRKIRRAFIAGPGSVLLSADYSQIDLRVLAHVSGDKMLTQAFERDEDVHLRTACEVFRAAPEAVDKELRRRAKAINFGIVYGQTAHGLSEQLGIPYGEAADYIKKYFERYAGVASWLKRNVEQARKDGYVRTFTGRLRRLPELAAKNAAVRQFSERAAGNTPIQGGSADVIKFAMLAVSEGLAEGRFKARMLLQIHDELLFELPKGELESFAPWVREKMEGACKLAVPLKVDVKAGLNWQDMSPVERARAPALERA